MTAVKLKLYEILDTKDKLTLLFSCGFWASQKVCEGLPTFATSSVFDIDTDGSLYPCPSDLAHPCTFDLNNDFSIRLQHDALAYHLRYLHLSPKEYYVKRKPYNEGVMSKVCQHKKTLCNLLQLDVNRFTLDIVYIDYFPKATRESSGFQELKERLTFSEYKAIALIGSFEENKWILANRYIYLRSIDNLSTCDHQDNTDHVTVFNIY
ncbi:hypothetical protein BCR42DRAFT_427186 [Absidia repens]|uniref:Uncharacterized protein n=1 Tax=Absidia repens TaxID=90262 RepID=A0A1X2I022_9FUNG|nr:hypothetical protein BCR42DRAFT_427186 [Absidia repens]